MIFHEPGIVGPKKGFKTPALPRVLRQRDSVTACVSEAQQ